MAYDETTALWHTSHHFKLLKPVNSCLSVAYQNKGLKW